MNDRVFAVLFDAGTVYAFSRALRVLAHHFARARYQHAVEQQRSCVGFIEREYWLKRAAFWRGMIHPEAKFKTIQDRLDPATWKR
jgi:hypothetical protein